MSADSTEGGQVIPMRSKQRRSSRAPGSGIQVHEAEAAEVLRNYYRSYGRTTVTIEPSNRQVEAMVDALVLTFNLRFVQS